MENKIIVGYKDYIKTLGYTKTTQYNLPKIIEEFLTFLKDKKIRKITENDIKRYQNYIETRPHKHSKSGSLSTSYIKQHVYAIKLFFGYLEQLEYIKTNPSTSIIYDKKVENNQREIVSQDEIRILFNNAETLIETAVLHLAYSAGMRKSEIENIEVRDIDFRANRIYIRAGKNKKRRVIPITEKVKNELKQYYLEQRSTTKSNYFLVNKVGNKINSNSIYKIVKPLINKAGLSENVCLHSLRHSIATHLLENGMKVEYVRDFLGHSQLKTTQIYTRINKLKLNNYDNTS